MAWWTLKERIIAAAIRQTRQRILKRDILKRMEGEWKDIPFPDRGVKYNQYMPGGAYTRAKLVYWYKKEFVKDITCHHIPHPKPRVRYKLRTVRIRTFFREGVLLTRYGELKNGTYWV